MKTKSKNLTIRLNSDLYNKIEESANLQKSSKGLIIKKALEEVLFNSKSKENSQEDVRKDMEQKYSHLLNRINILVKEINFIRNEIVHGRK